MSVHYYYLKKNAKKDATEFRKAGYTVDLYEVETVGRYKYALSVRRRQTYGGK